VDWPEPEAAAGQVVIRVTAAGLNFFDTLVTRGKYQHKPDLPFSPGGEVAGCIEKLGPDVTSLRPGQRVMAYTRLNGCRDLAVAQVQDVTPLPNDVSEEVAAGLTITYGTAMHGLCDRGMLQPNETVLILGATGGAGMAALEIAKLLGARVITAGTSDQKLRVCKDYGADETINLETADLRETLRECTSGKGVDVVYDCIGDRFAEPAVRALAWAGRYLVIGFAAGDIPKIPLNLLLLKGSSLIGVFWGRFVDLHPGRYREHMSQLLQWCGEGRLKPHIAKILPLEQTAQGLRLLEARQVTGKIIVKPGYNMENLNSPQPHG
jgi:NADPH2:quinone reductase